MVVTCTLSIGNDQEYPNVVVVIKGKPLSESGFIYLCVNDMVLQLRPEDVLAAVTRVQSK